MGQENEIVMLLLGIGVLFFLRGNHNQIARFPFSQHLMKGYYFLLAGWAFTVLEGFFLNQILRLVM